MDYKYTAIVLTKRDVGEADRIYTFFTREGGKVQARAVGIKKSHSKWASALENINLLDLILVKNKGIGKITGAIVENDFQLLRKNPAILGKALASFKGIDRIINLEYPDPKIFELIKGYLEILNNLENSDSRVALIDNGFWFQIYSFLGYAIELKDCVRCQGRLIAQENKYFSSEMGGIICQNCSRNLKEKQLISNDAIKTLRVILENKLQSLLKLKVSQGISEEIKVISNSFLSRISL